MPQTTHKAKANASAKEIEAQHAATVRQNGDASGLPVGLAPPEEDSLSAALEQLRGELGEDSELRVNVYRVDGKAREFCDFYKLGEITGEEGFLSRIRAEWGGGKFRVICHDGRGFRLNREVMIAMPRALAMPAAPMSDALATELRELRQQLAAASAPRSGADEMTRTLELVKLMRAAFGDERAREPREPRPSPASQIAEILTLIRGAKDLREEIEPTPPDTSLAGLAAQVLSMIQAQQSGAPAALANGQPQPQPQGQAMTAEQQAIRRAIDSLNTAAQFGMEPEGVAGAIFEQAEDQVLDMLTRATWFEEITAVAPDARPYQGWYTKARDEVLKLWAEEKGDITATVGKKAK